MNFYGPTDNTEISVLYRSVIVKPFPQHAQDEVSTSWIILIEHRKRRNSVKLGYRQRVDDLSKSTRLDLTTLITNLTRGRDQVI